MELRISTLDGGLIVRLSGKGDRKAVEQIQKALQSAEAKHVVFECAGVEYFNSTALGYFINLSDALRKIGGSVSFCRVSRRLKTAFDLLGLEEFFEFYPDEAKAADALRGVATDADVPEEWARGEIVLPSWLDDTPPLDHPRWIAFLQAAGEAAILEACSRAGVPPRGSLTQIARSLLTHFRTAEELLASFAPATIGKIGATLGVPGGIPAIVEFVHRSTAESLAVRPKAFDAESALRAVRMPKTVKTEAAARSAISSALGKAYRVARGKPVGTVKADLEVEGMYGLVVRMGPALTAARMATTLGSLLLLSGKYAKGTLCLITLGRVASDDELQPALERIGVRWIPLA